MSLDLIYGKPGHLFRRMQQVAVAIFFEECAGFDITPVQYAALVAIRARPGIDATRLSSLVAFDRSTVGSVLERLEGKGLIIRKPSPDDRRIKLLEITQQAEELLVAVEPAVARAQERMLEPLGRAERGRLLEQLTRLVHLNNDVTRAPLRVVGES
jgi:DNA-binding MarR family transcriptional regulator